jgi:hypothetical protein
MINKKIKSVEFKGMIYLSKLNRTWLLGEYGLSVPQSGVLLLSARASFKCSYDLSSAVETLLTHQGDYGSELVRSISIISMPSSIINTSALVQKPCLQFALI